METYGFALLWQSSQISRRWGCFYPIWYWWLRSTPWYITLLTVEFIAAKFWRSIISLSKNAVSITFMGERCCLTFVFHSWPSNFEVADSCFSRESKWGTQVSSHVTIFIILSPLLCIIRNHSTHTLIRFRICSLVRQCDSYVLKTLHMPNFFTIRTIVVCEMFRSVDKWWVVIRRLSAIKASTVFTLISVPTILGRPVCGMSPMEFRPLSNALCHRQMVALLKHRSPHTLHLRYLISRRQSSTHTIPDNITMFIFLFWFHCITKHTKHTTRV